MTAVLPEQRAQPQVGTDAVWLGRAEPHSPEWHATRASGIGGSEVAAILGLSPWASRYSLWHAKRNGWITEPDPEMEWGTRLEPALLAWYFDNRPEYRQIAPGGMYAHRSRPWQRANPDALAWDGTGLRVVEAKKASSDDWGQPGTDDVPVHYRVQVVQYMDVVGASCADVVVTNWGRAPQVYTVPYDPEEARLIRGHAAAFFRSLRHGIEPDLDAHSATYQAVRQLHPAIDGGEVEVPADVAADWTVTDALHRQAEAAAREAKARFLTHMGNARYASVQGVRVARRQPAGGAVALHPVKPPKNPEPQP